MDERKILDFEGREKHVQKARGEVMETDMKEAKLQKYKCVASGAEVLKIHFPFYKIISCS